MSFYSQYVNIRYLEAESHNPNYRTEFKLPNNIYAYPNLRLVNVGLSGAAGSLNRIGAVALIKHIYLYSDRELIDSVRYLNQWHSFNQLTESNQANHGVNKYLERSRIGYVITQNEQLESNDDVNAVDAQGDKTKGGSAYIALSKIFNILQKDNMILDTSKFPNLRVVVEWETAKLKYLGSGTNNNFTITQPTLVYDEISDPNIGAGLSKMMENMTFSSIEHDSIDAPSITAQADGFKQSLDKKLKGFDNKVITRLLVSKNYLNVNLAEGGGNSINGKGFFRSPVQYLEAVNIKVNGSPLFDENLKEEAVRQKMCANTWGALNTAPYETMLSNGLSHPAAQANFIGIPQDENLIGMASYLGARVEDRISDLEMHYERVKPSDNTAAIKKYAEHLTINVFAEVQKQIVLGKNGQFIVRYL